MVSFYFDRAGNMLQRTPLGMLRSLLQQYYKMSQTARDIILSAFDEKVSTFGEADNAWSWQVAELEELLVDVVSLSTSGRETVLLVDALDEAGEDVEIAGSTAQKLVSYLHRLGNNARENGALLKICISCQHYANVNVGRSLQIVVEDENEIALRSFVSQELREHVEEWEEQSKDGRRALVDMLVAKANRQFLWASIRVPMVVKSLNDGTHSLETVSELLESGSSKLSDLYKSVLTFNVSSTCKRFIFCVGCYWLRGHCN